MDPQALGQSIGPHGSRDQEDRGVPAVLEFDAPLQKGPTWVQMLENFPQANVREITHEAPRGQQQNDMDILWATWQALRIIYRMGQKR